MKFLLFAIVVSLLVQDGQSDMVATANLHMDGVPTGVGTILFHQRDEQSPVRVAGIIDGLATNTVHGFHVHRDGLARDVYNCTAAGPHFNPYNTSHGPREADLQHRHVGDLGNVTANEAGIIIVEINDGIISLYNPTRSIANRTVVLHAIRDDGGKGGFPDSNTTGNAGARIACGVIHLTSEISSSSKASSAIRNFIGKLFPF